MKPSILPIVVSNNWGSVVIMGLDISNWVAVSPAAGKGGKKELKKKKPTQQLKTNQNLNICAGPHPL